MLTKFCWAHGRTRFIAGLIVGLIGLLRVAGGYAAETGLLHLRCTNPSGANWSIDVDLEHGVVNSRPARITDSWISWRDPKAGIFEFERATGKLQLRAASSTGGFFLHYTCQPE